MSTFHSHHPKHERTLVIIKPDGIQRSLIGEIITRYERLGLKLIGLKMMIPTREMVEKHYTLDPDWKRLVGEKRMKAEAEKGGTLSETDPVKIGESVLATLANYLTAGPIIAMVWEGAHAVSIVRKITGGTEPRTSDVGTIRGDFMIDSYEMSEISNRSVRNLVHASGTTKEAQDEILHWFMPEELFNYRIVQEQILYQEDMGIL